MPLVMKKQLTFQVDVMLSPIPSTLKLMKDGTCKVQVCMDAKLTVESQNQIAGISQDELEALVSSGRIKLQLVPNLKIVVKQDVITG